MPNENKPVVLVADDEEEMRTLIQRFVESQGYKVHTAADGDEAWEMALKHRPDLVLLDVRMPGLSGWEVSRNIQHDSSLAHTQVIMITGIGETLNELTSPVFGAFSYLDKPFELDVLESKMRAALAASRSTRANGSSRGAATNGVSGPALPAGDDDDGESGFAPPRRSAASKGAAKAAKPAPKAAPKSSKPAAKSTKPAAKPAAKSAKAARPAAKSAKAAPKSSKPAAKSAKAAPKSSKPAAKSAKAAPKPAAKAAKPAAKGAKSSKAAPKSSKPAAKKPAAKSAKPAAKKAPAKKAAAGRGARG